MRLSAFRATGSGPDTIEPLAAAPGHSHSYIDTSGYEVLPRSVEFTQFTSWGFSELVRKHRLLGSMGTIGDCYDNAPMESFWGSMQIELLNRKKWRTKIELSIAIAEWIEHFYNPERLHSAIGYVPPEEFEALHLAPSASIQT
jgi:transposase InsO family protein